LEDYNTHNNSSLPLLRNTRNHKRYSRRYNRSEIKNVGEKKRRKFKMTGKKEIIDLPSVYHEEQIVDMRGDKTSTSIISITAETGDKAFEIYEKIKTKEGKK